MKCVSCCSFRPVRRARRRTRRCSICGRRARSRSASTRRAKAERGKPPVYTAAGAAAAAANPLYDYVFLNLEGAYDAAAVKVYGEVLKKSSRKTLIVRIPPIYKDGADATKARVKEIFDAGADGVTIPHIRDLDEAKLALSFFTAAKANVWSPKNPKGTKLAMLMLEDPKAIDAAQGDRRSSRHQHPRLRHRQPVAGARRRSRRSRSAARSRCSSKPSA